MTVLNRAGFAKERVILECRGKAIAAVVPIDDLETIEDKRDIADALAARKEAARKAQNRSRSSATN